MNSDNKINLLDQLKKMREEDKNLSLSLKNKKTVNWMKSMQLHAKKIKDHQSKEIWDNIPITYFEPMEIQEALVRELEIVGLDAYSKMKEKNSDVKKYSIVMNETADDGTAISKLVYFPVTPSREQDFLNAFNEGEQYYEMSGGRKPFLIQDEKDKKLTTKEIVENSLNNISNNAISTTQHLQNEIDYAVQNDNANLVDNLYTHMSNLEKLPESNPYNLPTWQLTYYNYLRREAIRKAEEDVRKASERGLEVNTSLAGNTFTYPEGIEIFPGYTVDKFTIDLNGNLFLGY